MRPAEPGDVEFLTRVHAAGSALAHALALPPVRAVWAATTPAHAASIRVMQKLGMVCRRRTLLDGIDSVIYSIDRGEFERRDRSVPAR